MRNRSVLSSIAKQWLSADEIEIEGRRNIVFRELLALGAGLVVAPCPGELHSGRFR